MTDLQRAALRAKEIQGRLAELGGKSEYNDDERGELDKLRNEYVDLTRRMSALEIADMVETPTEDHQETELLTRGNVGEVFDTVLLARKRKRRERRDSGALRHRREPDTPRHATARGRQRRPADARRHPRTCERGAEPSGDCSVGVPR